jgi:glycosyltransferase involved in cell wall biosynthesis
VRLLLRDAEKIICFSRQECDDYAKLLRLPRERFLFLPTPWLATETISMDDDGYILALGQSNRDYRTLLEAVRGTELPIVIVAGDVSALDGVVPSPNVCVKYNTGHQETIDLIARASLHCIPLHPSEYSAGQTVLLRAMARGKAVVVSDTPGIRDYVRSGETAVLVPPCDATRLREELTRLWNDVSERKRIGKQAASAVREEFGFERFTLSLAEIAEKIAA